MAEFGAAGAGLRDEDRRALKEGKKLLKKALGAAGMGSLLKGGRSKEKLRREKQRRREVQQAAAARQSAAETRARQSAAREAMVRRCAAAERAKHSRARDEERAAAEREREEERAAAQREREEERAAAQRAREEDRARLEAEREAAVAAARAEAEAARREAEGDFKSVAAERALADRATDALAAERAASQARAQREAEAERRRQAAEEAAQRRERDLRQQIRTKERELEEHEGGGFEDVCGLFSGVSGGVAARARGAALREAKQELERRRAELAVVVAQSADRERAFADELAAAQATAAATASRQDDAHIDAARAEAAARTAAADAALRERDDAAAAAERERARWYAASFELQTAEKHAQNTLDLKNLELREQVQRSNATEAELRRLKAELEEARSTAEAQRSRAQFYVTEAQRRDASGGNENHRVRYLEAELERLERERDLERERASRQARLTETQLRFAEAELGRTRDAQQNDAAARAAAGPLARQAELTRALLAQNPGWVEMFRRPPGHWKCDACWVWNDTEATACVACETPKPGAAPTPTPAGPFSGSQSFSIGTSTAPKRGKSGRRILKAKRPPPVAVKAKRPPPVADLYMESTFEAGGAAVRLVGLSNFHLRRGRVALEQPQDLTDRGRIAVHVTGDWSETLPFALENVRAEPGSEAELERLKAYIRQARSTAEAQNSQARWDSSPFSPPAAAPSAPDTTRPIPEEMKRRVLGDADANAAAERIAAMRDADAKRIVADAELGRANLDSVRRLQRDWYAACLPAEDERGAAATSRPGPAAWGWSSPAEQTPAAAAAASPFAPPPAPFAPVPPPAPRAPQPAVVQQTTYYSSSPRPAPTPPRRSSSGGARMGTVLRNDGLPDRRYASPRPVTTSGRPDRRFSVNRPATSSTRSSGSGSGRRSGGRRK